MKLVNYMLWLLLVAGTTVTAIAGPQKIKTQVEKVTLFIDGAQITRTKQINLPAGNSTLLFTGLSPYMDDKSMQVRAEGDFTITAVNRLFNYTDSLERSTRQQVLEQELTETERQQKELKASREVLNAESELLKINCSVGNRNVATPLTTIRELNEYYAARLQAMAQKALELDERVNVLKNRVQQLQNELAQLGGIRQDPMSEVEVRIEAPKACIASFTLTYYVRNASWFPSYDIRSGGLSKPIKIAYKANIIQNTKEDWKNVELSLSSSNPNTGNIAPQLKTYWLDYGLGAPRYNLNLANNTISGTVFSESREPIAGATVFVPGSTVGTYTNAQGRYSLTIPNGTSNLQFNFIGYDPRTVDITSNTMNVTLKESVTAMSEVVVVGYGVDRKTPGGQLAGAAAPKKLNTRIMTVESAPIVVEQTQNQIGYEFEIKQPYSVPSDGKAVTVEIGRFDLPAAYSYQSTPKIDKDAFLMAETTDWEKLNLLEGEANVYFENTFVGKSLLDPNQTNDTLRFSLGRDRSIRIERTKETDFVSRKSIGSNRTQTMAWKFTIRNTRPEPVMLTLYDQVPVSQNSTITVTPGELSGGQLDQDLGIITWKLDLKPGEQRELKLRYEVKYPKGKNLVVE